MKQNAYVLDNFEKYVFTSEVGHHEEREVGKKYRILIVTKLLTSYQKDFFKALSEIEGVEAVAIQFAPAESRVMYLGEKKKFVNCFESLSNTSSYNDVSRAVIDSLTTHVVLGGFRSSLCRKVARSARRENVHVGFWMERPMSSSLLISCARAIQTSLMICPSDSIFAVDRRAEKFYQKYSNRVFRFPYSISVKRFPVKNIPKKINNKLKVLYCGQLIERKNIWNMVEAFKGLDGNCFELSIVGSGALEADLQEYLASKGNASIKLLGRLPNDELGDVYRSHDVFLLPSRHDGWGVVVVEAMCCGVFVVVSDQVGASDLMRGRPGGLIVGSSVGEIRDAMKSIHNDREKIAFDGFLNAEFIRNSICSSTNLALHMLRAFEK